MDVAMYFAYAAGKAKLTGPAFQSETGKKAMTLMKNLAINWIMYTTIIRTILKNKIKLKCKYTQKTYNVLKKRGKM